MRFYRGRCHSRMTSWRSRIAVHSTRLESVRAQAHVGSNPTSSAILRQGYGLADALCTIRIF